MSQSKHYKRVNSKYMATKISFNKLFNAIIIYYIKRKSE